MLNCGALHPRAGGFSHQEVMGSMANGNGVKKGKDGWVVVQWKRGRGVLGRVDRQNSNAGRWDGAWGRGGGQGTELNWG